MRARVPTFPWETPARNGRDPASFKGHKRAGPQMGGFRCCIWTNAARFHNRGGRGAGAGNFLNFHGRSRHGISLGPGVSPREGKCGGEPDRSVNTKTSQKPGGGPGHLSLRIQSGLCGGQRALSGPALSPEGKKGASASLKIGSMKNLIGLFFCPFALKSLYRARFFPSRILGGEEGGGIFRGKIRRPRTFGFPQTTLKTDIGKFSIFFSPARGGGWG